MSVSQQQQRINLDFDKWLADIESIGSENEDNDDIVIVHNESDSQGQPVVPMEEMSVDVFTSSCQDKYVGVNLSCKCLSKRCLKI